MYTHTLEKAKKFSNSHLGKNEYPDSQLINALKTAADVHDGHISAPIYDKLRTNGMDLPTRSVIEMRYGSWSYALDAAGIPTNPAPRKSYKRANYVGAVKTVWNALGRPPSVTDYIVYRRVHPELNLPCDAIIRRNLRSWVTALELAQK